MINLGAIFPAQLHADNQEDKTRTTWQLSIFGAIFPAPLYTAHQEDTTDL
jgi:hypothetical protein